MKRMTAAQALELSSNAALVKAAIEEEAVFLDIQRKAEAGKTLLERPIRWSSTLEVLRAAGFKVTPPYHANGCTTIRW